MKVYKFERNGFTINITIGEDNLEVIIYNDNMDMLYNENGNKWAFTIIYFAGCEERLYSVEESHEGMIANFWRPLVCRLLGNFIGATRNRFLYTYEWKNASAEIIELINIIYSL